MLRIAGSAEAFDPVVWVDCFPMQHGLGGELTNDGTKRVAVGGDGIVETAQAGGLAEQGRAVDCGVDAGPGADDGQGFDHRQCAFADPEITLDILP